MKELLNDTKKFLGFVAAILLVYVCFRYWPSIEHMLVVGLGAGVPLLIGCAIAYVINILMSFYEDWYVKLFKVDVTVKIRRVICMIFAFLTLFAILFLIINLVLPELINCIAFFIRLIPEILQTIVDYVGEETILQMFPMLQSDFDFSTLSTEIEKLGQTIFDGVGGAVGSIWAGLMSVFGVTLDVVIGFIFSLYILLDKEKLSRQAKQLINTYLPKVSEKIFYVVNVVNDSFRSFIVGQCTEAVILGVLCIIGMWIFQLPYAVMIGVFIGFTALVPIVGAYLGATVGVILILTVSPLQAIQFLVFIVVLQQLEGNLIYPRVVGQSMGLPGIWVLTAITVGGGILGIGGMLLAVPLFAAGYRLIKEDVARRALVTTVETKVEKAVGTEEKHPVNEDASNEN